MRSITYKPRQAKTATYWDMSDEDFKFVVRQLELVLIEYAERSISGDQLDKNYTAIITGSGSGLGYSPMHKCQNTIASAIGGILKNFRNGTRDLTDKNCEKIHYMAPNVRVCGAGTAADCDHVTEMMSRELALHRLNTHSETRVKMVADRKSTRLNSSHIPLSRMPSSA